MFIFIELYTFLCKILIISLGINFFELLLIRIRISREISIKERRNVDLKEFVSEVVYGCIIDDSSSHVLLWLCGMHYNDVTMSKIASQITSLTIVYSTVYSGPDQIKHQNSASLAFVRGIHRGPVNSPHKWPVTRKMFPFDDVIML